ncbi:hypothetical protein A5320_09000 [Rheinheimera sp. SA_1]|uniref:hypothetical protein n=1 Tax=Rheinheimera sp. SA_1 TaxID=1827365 RepID=UPI0007FBC0DE|nr:hypothetical protein [Rheinheimera sp. SA_1]OBP15478.1 hypothetical protein A5320_09000 [Rheinheimera sp. SA_1]
MKKFVVQSLLLVVLIVIFSVAGRAINEWYTDYSVVSYSDNQLLIPENVDLVIYSVDSCKACMALTKYLDDRKINYIKKDIVSNKQNENEFEGLDGSIVPLIVNKDWIMRGFYPQKLDSILK